MPDHAAFVITEYTAKCYGCDWTFTGSDEDEVHGEAMAHELGHVG